VGGRQAHPPVAVAASGLAGGEEPLPGIAAAAVRLALERANCECASSILLFLSAEFARSAQAAVTAASRAGNCLQVAGCCVPGVFTESDWLIDRPGAAALVLCGDLALGPPRPGSAVLSLARPEDVTPDWLAAHGQRCGSVATDSTALRPGKTWQHGKAGVDPCSLGVAGARSRTGISRGLRALGAPLVADAEGYELRRLGAQPALDSLRRALPLEFRDADALPLHLVFAGVLDDDAGDDLAVALASGRFALQAILAANADSGAVTLAASVPRAARIFWAIRQVLAAEQDMQAMLTGLAPSEEPDPSFAVMFSCMGRGPYFYDGADRDVELVRQRFPGLPLVGVYGGGEIAPLPAGNALIHNSVILTLFDVGNVQPEP
jgi:hypothetical protein